MATSQRRKKVAVVYHYFAHFRAAVMTELLASPQHDYVLVGEKKDVTGGRKVWDVPAQSLLMETPCRYFGPLMFQRGLVRLALRRDLDTIIYLGNAYWPSTWISAIIARWTGKRVLFWTIGWIGPDSGFKRRLRLAFYRLPHALLLYGHYAKSIGIREGFGPEKLHVVYNSLDYPKQKQARERVTKQQMQQVRESFFPDSPRRATLICVTSLVPKRRLDLLLEAMKILRDEGHETNLLLVGAGPEKQKLESLAGTLGLSVHFYGPCYDDEILAGLILSANVTVAPGMVGLTAMQSLAFGRPVITQGDPDSQAPEWEAIVEGQSGGFFRANDTRDLARVIKEWTQTETLPDEVAARCYGLIERFYNPQFQRRAIDRAVSGLPADDLFWMRENTTETAAETTGKITKETTAATREIPAL